MVVLMRSFFNIWLKPFIFVVPISASLTKLLRPRQSHNPYLLFFSWASFSTVRSVTFLSNIDLQSDHITPLLPLLVWSIPSLEHTPNSWPWPSWPGLVYLSNLTSSHTPICSGKPGHNKFPTISHILKVYGSLGLFPAPSSAKKALCLQRTYCRTSPFRSLLRCPSSQRMFLSTFSILPHLPRLTFHVTRIAIEITSFPPLLASPTGIEVSWACGLLCILLLCPPDLSVCYLGSIEYLFVDWITK